MTDAREKALEAWTDATDLTVIGKFESFLAGYDAGASELDRLRAELADANEALERERAMKFCLQCLRACPEAQSELAASQERVRELDEALRQANIGQSAQAERLGRQDARISELVARVIQAEDASIRHQQFGIEQISRAETAERELRETHAQLTAVLDALSCEQSLRLTAERVIASQAARIRELESYSHSLATAVDDLSEARAVIEGVTADEHAANQRANRLAAECQALQGQLALAKQPKVLRSKPGALSAITRLANRAERFEGILIRVSEYVCGLRAPVTGSELDQLRALLAPPTTEGE